MSSAYTSHGLPLRACKATGQATRDTPLRSRLTALSRAHSRGPVGPRARIKKKKKKKKEEQCFFL